MNGYYHKAKMHSADLLVASQLWTILVTDNNINLRVACYAIGHTLQIQQYDKTVIFYYITTLLGTQC